MRLSPFGRSKSTTGAVGGRGPRQVPLLDATLKNFSGGLNTVDEDLNIKTFYAIDLVNFRCNLDGTLALRFGTKFEWDVSTKVSGNIIEGLYFNGRSIAFTDTGEIATVESDGTITAIWNNSIAVLLAGSPSGWSSGLTTIDYSEFKNELVVCNGTDKPILIASDFTITYLQDIPTGSNIFVPTGKFVTTVANYVVIAGITGSEDEIYISAKGASGTWPGDPDPNDAISLNIGTYAPEAGGGIRGLSSFRNFLLIHFVNQTIVFSLGTYSGSTHAPEPLDTIPNYGIVSHRCSVTMNKDILFADRKGVHTGKRNVFGSAIDATDLTDKIIPDFSAAVPNEDANRDKSYCIHNDLEKEVMFFLYNGTAYSIYTMTYGTELTAKKTRWSKYSGLDFNCAWVSELNRVYFAKGSKIYQYGNKRFSGEDYFADRVGEYDTSWATTTAYVVGDRVLQNSTVYVCLLAHTSGTFSVDLDDKLWEVYEGEAIEFTWELPWTDFNKRVRVKQLQFVHADAWGTSSFTMQLFADHIYRDEADELNPLLSLDFVSGHVRGYGNYDQPYGGGRKLSSGNLFGTPADFKVAKVRVSGSTKKDLGFSTLTFFYRMGTFHR